MSFPHAYLSFRDGSLYDARLVTIIAFILCMMYIRSHWIPRRYILVYDEVIKPEGFLFSGWCITPLIYFKYSFADTMFILNPSHGTSAPGRWMFQGEQLSKIPMTIPKTFNSTQLWYAINVYRALWHIWRSRSFSPLFDWHLGALYLI